MTVTVSPGKGNLNTHHLKLTDPAGTSIGLITTGVGGSRKPQVSVSPYPAMASQLRQGRGKHADRVPPFEDIALGDFSGGLAMLHHDEDQSRYLDGKRMDTSRPGSVIHGPLESYTTGLRDFDEVWSGNVTWQALNSGGTTSVDATFVAGATYTAKSGVIIIKKTGSPTGDITVTLENNGGGSPVTKTITIGTDALSDLVSETFKFDWSATKALTASSSYDITVAYSGGDATNYVEVAVDGSTNPYFRVLDDTGDFRLQMVEYKGALYGVTVYEDNTASDLYILGYRGVATDNTGALDTLIDAGTPSWTVNEFAGMIVKLVGGYAHREETPWRTILSNTADTLTLDSAWDVVHDDDRAHYVIMGTKWRLWQALPAKVTDITSSGNNLYISYGYAIGDSARHPDRFWEENLPIGTWTKTLELEDNNTLGFIKTGYIPVGNMTHQKAEGVWLGNFYAITVTDEVKLQRWDVPFQSNLDLNKLIKNIYTPHLEKAWIETSYTGVNYGEIGGIFYAGWGATASVGRCAHLKLDRPIDMTLGWGVILTYGLYNLETPGNYADAGDIRLVFCDVDDNEEYVEIGGPSWGEDSIGSELFFFPRGFNMASLTCDIQAITDIYIEIVNDEGTVDIPILQLDMVADRGWTTECWFGLPYHEKINHILPYAGGAGETSLKPWIITAAGVYYIEGDVLKRIPLGELEELTHSRSGEGACVNDVYLIWNHGETIQSYYAGQLKSIGPDVDYGLPADRRGIPASLASYPGKLFAGIDAGTGVSSVIYRKGHGWHEAYRAVNGDRIKSLHILGREDQADQLYVSQGADVLWVPVSINPETESGYEYTHEAVLETSRIYGGLRETEKYYHAINLVTENLSDGNRWIEVDYRTSENSTWTTIGTDFVTSPRQRQALVSTNNTSGRWIQFRFRSYTNDRTETPKLVSAVIDSLERLDSANTYSYNIRLKEGKDQDLRGNTETQTGKAKWQQLQTWVDSPLPLTLNSTSAFEDGKLVFVEPERSRVLYSKVDDTEQEVRIYQLTLIEVE